MHGRLLIGGDIGNDGSRDRDHPCANAGVRGGHFLLRLLHQMPDTGLHCTPFLVMPCARVGVDVARHHYVFLSNN